MPIPDHIIDRIRDETDIVGLIGEVVPLKKRGKNHVGLCPFHPEKTPSFSVSADKQMYYCFGCQAGGNAFSFVMEHEKLDFPDAVRTLGRRIGVEVPDRETVEGDDPNAGLYQANRMAAEFYHTLLMESADAAAARTHLESRGLDRSVWEIFMLGWAPDRWDALVDEAGRQGIEPDTLLAAGLAARSEKTHGVYDRFRNRICFPIRAIGGRTIAFSGRLVADGEPKYLNSSDTAIFSKGRTLFNLDHARGPIRKEGAAIVVEGNFDVVGLHGAGFRNVVAPLGTALTEAQAAILKRYTTTAYLANDGDAAGERAAFRAADVLLAAGFSVRIVTLPPGADPDTVIREAGAPGFAGALESSRDVIERKLEVVAERVDLSDVMKKRRAIRRLLKSVERVPDSVTRSLYRDRISSALNVSADSLRRSSTRAGPERAEPTPRPRRTRVVSPAGVVFPEAQDERYVLLHAMNDPRWLSETTSLCRPEYFVDDGLRKLFERLSTIDPEEADPEEWIRRISEPELQGIIAGLEVWRAAHGFPLSEASFRDSLGRLLVKALDRGVMTEFEASGERLADAVRRRDLQRRLERRDLKPEGI